MKVTIEEVFNDLYKLAQEEGYFSCLCEQIEVNDEDCREYHDNVLTICEKYIPDYKKYLPQRYNESKNWDEKGLMISQLAEENFRQLIYGLMYKKENGD